MDASGIVNNLAVDAGSVVTLTVSFLLQSTLLIGLGLLAARWVRRMGAAEESVQRMCRELAGGLGVRPPPVLLSDRMAVPCLIGARRPAILLPAAGVPGPAELRHVLLHELVHLRRRDCLWNLLGHAAGAVFWFQPLLRVLRRRIERASDDVCDDHVLAAGGDRRSYASCLLAIAERLQRPGLEAVLAAPMASSQSALGGRVERILDVSRVLSLRSGRGTSAAITSVLIVVTMTCGVLNVQASGVKESTQVADRPPDVADIIRGTDLMETRLRDYQLSYRVSKSWMYKDIIEWVDAPPGSPRESVPKLVRREPKTEEERQRSMTSEYAWRAKGARFAYTRDFQDHINNLEHSEQHAFNGVRHMHLNKHGDILSGVTEAAGAEHQSIPLDVIRPEHFFSQLGYKPVADWLRGPLVTVMEGTEIIAGKRCHVVECMNADGRLGATLWISPEVGFRPMRMRYYLANGSSCSYEVLEMKEVAAGVWFPIRGTEQWHVPLPGGDAPVLYSAADFEVDPSSLKVNTGIEDEAFELTFPVGTQVHDRTAETLRIVGQAGSIGGLRHQPVDEEAASQPESPREAHGESTSRLTTREARVPQPMASRAMRDEALARLQPLYQPADGAVLKCVPAPYPAERNAYMRLVFAGLDNRMIERGGNYFHFSDGKLRHWGGPVGAAPSVEEIVASLTGIAREEIEGDPDLLKTRLAADFILRSDAPPEDVLAPLEHIFRNEFKLPLKLIIREEEREVIVVRGEYDFKPAADGRDGRIEIYDRELTNPRYGGGGTGDFDRFLAMVGDHIGRRFVDEVEYPPGRVSWHYNRSRDASGRPDPDLVLQRLAEQTGLTFTRENRTVPILFVEKAD